MDNSEQRGEELNNPPVPKPAGCGFLSINILLILFGGWLGWQAGIPYILPLTEYFEISFKEIDSDLFIPVLEKTIHVDALFICCAFGAFCGALGGNLVSEIIKAILQRCNLLPPDPPPKPKPERKTQKINLDDLDLGSLAMIEKDTQMFDRGFREGLRRIRYFALSLLGANEAFAVQICCTESFLLRELSREVAETQPLALMVTKDSERRTVVHEIILTPVTEVKENGVVCWRTASDSILPWIMICQPQKRDLLISFSPARRIGLCFYVLGVIAILLPLLIGEPKLWFLVAFAIYVAFAILWDQQRYACMVFGKRLQDIEEAYARCSGMEKRET